MCKGKGREGGGGGGGGREGRGVRTDLDVSSDK